MKKTLTFFGILLCMVTFTANADIIFARASNIWITGIQHTYVCKQQGPSKPAICYGNPGSNSGGAYLAGTMGNGDGNKVTCAGTNNACRITWGWHGTCHQGANRMLRPANKTVSQAGGYSVSVRLYGTYGIRNWDSCRQVCRL